MITRLFLAFLALLLPGCDINVPDDNPPPLMIFKNGAGYMTEGSYVAPGALMKFGISATGGGSVITNLVVKREADGVIVTELDRGLWSEYGGLDTTVTFMRGYAETEKWTFSVMNSRRETASVTMNVYKGEGSAWGEINHFTSVTLGMQSSTLLPHYLDLTTGDVYTDAGVSGHEMTVDMAVFWYISSGKSSPTLTCPAYNSALTYYPEFGSWPVRNQTLYDYYTSDFDLVSAEDFDDAENDSLLVMAYRSQTVSGQSKFAYTGKIVPFRTSDGKYGMIKVMRADETADGSMEVEIKIQK